MKTTNILIGHFISLEVLEYFCALIFNAKNNFAKLITAFRDFFEFVPFGFIVFPNGGNVFEYKDIKTFLKTELYLTV